MTPYYEHAGITIYHGDCRDVLADIDPVDVVITDPPYDERTHAGARTLSMDARVKASAGKRGIVASAAMPIDFNPLLSLEFTAGLWQWATRWCVIFCSMEMLGTYRDLAPECWIRSGFWRRPDGAPQITGDRPAQPGEGIAILHRPGRKRWNRGGHHAYWEYGIERGDRIHPTQKPEPLMCALVLDFSDSGETILDPFMGSGTTLVAAKRLGRNAIGIEIQEQYCEQAAKRLSQETLIGLMVEEDSISQESLPISE